jgi:hypothetical protein
MPSCPACGRSVALTRASCLYCGAPLAAATVARAEPAPAAAPPAVPRVLVLLDLAGEPATLAAALGVSHYEATLLARRGGLHLVRAVAPADADAEAGRLRAQGVEPWLVPEAEVRAPPILCLAGERRGAELLLRTTQAPVTLARGDALLVVRGAITREYQTPLERRRIATARPEEGYRVQVHRRADTRALEIDALNFELGFAVSGSARLEIDAWLEAVVGDAPRDSGFARLGAVLGPTAPEPGGALAAAGTLAAASRGGAGEGRPVVLDNLAQFRFYSGCLAAVCRRRAARSAPGV